MQIVCAWCKRLISDDGAEPEVVSHGICPRCFEEAEKQIMALDPHARPHHVANGGEG